MTNNLENILLPIAQKHLGMDTLETRNSDRLDFHEVSAWDVREALHAAFVVGQAAGNQAAV